MANDKFYGYTPKYAKPSGKEGTIRSGAEEGNTQEHLGNSLDRVNPYEFRKGMDYELTAIGCSRLAESTPEEREKASEKVIKNLEEHGGYYTALITYETNFRNKENKPSFKSWLSEQDEFRMKEVDQKFKNDKMEEPKKSKEEYTKKFETSPSPLKETIKMKALKEAIKAEIKNTLKEQDGDEEEFDADIEKADKAASKAAKKGTKAGKANRFDAEKEAIKDLLYRGKKGSDSEHTEQEPAPKSILDVKNDMLKTYKEKFKGKEGGLEEYNNLLVKANEKFTKILEKHVKNFGEEGKGNNVTLDTVYGEKLPDTIKLLGARIKELEKEEQEDLIATNELRREVALTDMTRAQHIKLLEIIREKGVSLREGAMGVKVYYEIAKAAYLEGLSNGLKL